MGTKLFVGGLAWGTDSDTLRSHFEQFGEVTDAEVILDRESKRSRGFGFVTFGSSSEAQQAIDTTNDQPLDGRKIRVDFAGERSSSSSSSSRRSNYGGSPSQRGGSFGGGAGGDRRRNTRYEARPSRDNYERPRPSRHSTERTNETWNRNPTEDY